MDYKKKNIRESRDSDLKKKRTSIQSVITNFAYIWKILIYLLFI